MNVKNYGKETEIQHILQDALIRSTELKDVSGLIISMSHIDDKGVKTITSYTLGGSAELIGLCVLLQGDIVKDFTSQD